jgi:hypothetical protein
MRTKTPPGRRALRAIPSTARLLVGAGRIHVRPAGSAADREHTRHVRHEVYCVEKEFLHPDALFDAYDTHATLLNAYHRDQPVGTLRITDSADGPLEIFDMHPELASTVRPGARLLEVSRLMVVRSYRGFEATMPLFRRVFAELLERKADGLIVSCAQPLIPYYRDLMGFRQLSTEPLHHQRLRGLTDYAMILDMPDVLAHATAVRLPIWMAIHPTLCVRALGLTAARKLRRFLPQSRPALEGGIA